METPSEHRSVLRTLASESTLVVAAVTLYAYFLGWVALWTKMTILDIPNELGNLPITDYLLPLGGILTGLGLAAGGAVIAAVLHRPIWYVGLIPEAIFLTLRIQQARELYPTHPRLLWFGGGVIAGAGVILALMGAAARYGVMRWRAASRHESFVYRPRNRLLPLLVVAGVFLVFLKASAFGVTEGLSILRKPMRAVLETSSPALQERIKDKSLLYLMQVEDRVYFADVSDLTFFSREEDITLSPAPSDPDHVGGVIEVTRESGTITVKAVRFYLPPFTVEGRIVVISKDSISSMELRAATAPDSSTPHAAEPPTPSPQPTPQPASQETREGPPKDPAAK